MPHIARDGDGCAVAERSVSMPSQLRTRTRDALASSRRRQRALGTLLPAVERADQRGTEVVGSGAHRKPNVLRRRRAAGSEEALGDLDLVVGKLQLGAAQPLEQVDLGEHVRARLDALDLGEETLPTGLAVGPNRAFDGDECRAGLEHVAAGRELRRQHLAQLLDAAPGQELRRELDASW